MKVAVTFLAALRVTVQLAVPVQSPLQPTKVEPASAVAVSVTVVPEAKLAEQVAPQLMLAGKEDTLPVPVPDFDTESAKLAAAPTENDCVTREAGSKLVLPAWSAAIVQEPAATPVTVVPETVQTEEVREVKVTASPEVLVALTVAAPPTLTPEGAVPKVMSCAAAPMGGESFIRRWSCRGS